MKLPITIKRCNPSDLTDGFGVEEPINHPHCCMDSSYRCISKLHITQTIYQSKHPVRVS